MHGHVLLYFWVYTEYYPLVSWTCFGSQIALLGMLNARRFRCMPLAPLRSLLLLAALAASAASAADARSSFRPLTSESRRDMASCWGRSQVECFSPRLCDGIQVSLAEADPISSQLDGTVRARIRPSATRKLV